MQNFAPPPEPCNFLKGVGAVLENPVDPRLVQYRKATNEREANESETQRLTDTIEQMEQSLRELSQGAMALKGRVTEQEKTIEEQERKVHDLEQQLNVLLLLASKQKANAAPPSDAGASGKRHKSSPGPSGAVSEDTPNDAAGKKRKAPMI